MPTQGIWAPRAQLLLALFLPFLTRGGGIALAMAKPLNLSELSYAFSLPRCCRLPISWLQEEVPLGSTAQSCPTWGHVGGGRGERCASGVPRDPSARQPPPAGTSRASGLPALLLFPLRLPRQEPLWPVKLSVPQGAAPAVASPGPWGKWQQGWGNQGSCARPPSARAGQEHPAPRV